MQHTDRPAEAVEPKNDKNNSTRRAFLGAGSMAAAWAAVTLAKPVAAAAQDDNGAPQAGGGAPFLNVCDFGAVGDGEADDTDALKKAVAAAARERIGTVYLPGGVYRLSDAVKLPSHIALLGAGPGLTVLQAVADTLFPLFKPDPRTQSVRQRRTMITTASAGTVRKQVTEHAGLARLTVDWNHCPTEGFGSSCVLIDSADHVRLDRVEFVRCLPSDHPRRIEDMRGSGFRSECIMFSNANHGLMDGCSLVDSGYRPLSVAYGSQDITFQNGRVTAVNPVWRHAFAEVHGDGIPRDEHYRHSQLKFLNSTFRLEGGTAQDGICSHTGTLHVENCDFFILGGTAHFGYVLKPFDSSVRFQCLNNRFYCEGEYEEQFSVAGTIGGPRSDNQELVFVGNIVNVAFGADSANGRMGERGLIDFSVNNRRSRVQSNQFRIRIETPGERAAVRLRNVRAGSVADNLIEFTGDENGATNVGIDVADCRAVCVSANVVAGTYQDGVRLSGELSGVVVNGNSVAAAAGQGVNDQSEGGTLTAGNLE